MGKGHKEGGKNYGVPGPGFRRGGQTLFLLLKKGGTDTFLGSEKGGKHTFLVFEKGGQVLFLGLFWD